MRASGNQNVAGVFETCCNDSPSQRLLQRKSSKRAAKEFADAVPFRFTVSDQQRELPPGALQFPFLVRRASSKPFRRYAFPGRAASGSPGSRCVKHWWKGAVTLQIRALRAIGTTR